MPVVTSFTIASGTYTDEQDLLASLDTFITGTISGWSQVKVITDTASDKHIAYSAVGDGSRDRNDVSVRATGDYLEFHCYSWFDVDTDTGHDDLYGTETRIPTSTTSGTYWFLGNRDAIYVSVEHSATSDPHLGGFGQFISYYSAEEDPKPYYVFGQVAASTLFNNASERVRSWHPSAFGAGYNPLSPLPTYSGAAMNCRSAHYDEIQYGVSQSRTDQPYFFEPIFTGVETGIDMKGEIPGLKLIGLSPYSHGNIITVLGINLINGDYFVQSHTNASPVGWCVGRVFTV
jgi:hypothetical protein